jgi:hypothetical protein
MEWYSAPSPGLVRRRTRLSGAISIGRLIVGLWVLIGPGGAYSRSTNNCILGLVDPGPEPLQFLAVVRTALVWFGPIIQP